MRVTPREARYWYGVQVSLLPVCTHPDTSSLVPIHDKLDAIDTSSFTDRALSSLSRETSRFHGGTRFRHWGQEWVVVVAAVGRDATCVMLSGGSIAGVQEVESSGEIEETEEMVSMPYTECV